MTDPSTTDRLIECAVTLGAILERLTEIRARELALIEGMVEESDDETDDDEAPAPMDLSGRPIVIRGVRPA